MQRVEIRGVVFGPGHGCQKGDMVTVDSLVKVEGYALLTNLVPATGDLCRYPDDKGGVWLHAREMMEGVETSAVVAEGDLWLQPTEVGRWNARDYAVNGWYNEVQMTGVEGGKPKKLREGWEGRVVKVEGWIYLQTRFDRPVCARGMGCRERDYDIRGDTMGERTRMVGLKLGGICEGSGGVVVYDGMSRRVKNGGEVREMFERRLLGHGGGRARGQEVNLGIVRNWDYTAIAGMTMRCGVYLLDGRDEVYNMLGVGRTGGSCAVVIGGEGEMEGFLRSIGLRVFRVNLPESCMQMGRKGIDEGRCEKEMGGAVKGRGVMVGMDARQFRVGTRWLEGQMGRIVEECGM